MADSVRKICLLGDFGVGKTSLVAQFVHRSFSEKYLSTVGVRTDTKVLELDSGESRKLVIWDIEGTSEASPMYRTYLRGMAGFLMVADGTRRDTLNQAVQLRAQLPAELAGLPGIGLVNKSDLTDQWEVDDAQLAERAAAGETWLISSAKTGDNVELAFNALAKAMP